MLIQARTHTLYTHACICHYYNNTHTHTHATIREQTMHVCEHAKRSFIKQFPTPCNPPQDISITVNLRTMSELASKRDTEKGERERKSMVQLQPCVCSCCVFTSRTEVSHHVKRLRPLLTWSSELKEHYPLETAGIIQDTGSIWGFSRSLTGKNMK